ncbi:hypothetical protein MJO29_004105 [Puccinia striiformis f. sp. tritici]|uniref:Uncharacterized protein n=1 Tax=Puccinia striiformis f. sp. tritici PST-78 TaxID=1165861 RepID=A0A0L0UUE0_9BASI|nr:hypothetical protein MJO29_004105 [Puccinia striiformis f. sp. tritici]KNE90546.1 hypothetical protein PSTG_16008 [Puccinia striiformis f. sp. tritici PST-78]
MLDMLDAKYIYSIPGKKIIPNSKCQPTLNYFHECVTRICLKSQRADGSINKTTVTGVGCVLSASKIKGDNDQHEDGSLVLIVSHSDWDPVDRVVIPFSVRYIVPVSPRLVNAQKLVGVGRDFLFEGFLAGRDLHENMAIVEVISLASNTPGQGGLGARSQLGTPNPSPDARGRRLITYPESGAPEASTSSTTLDNGVLNESTDSVEVSAAQPLDEGMVDDDDMSGDDLPHSSTPLGKRKGKKPANLEAAKKMKGV